MVLRFLKDTREYLTPVLTTSFFIEKGILTPEEFIKAGDHLVHTCPSWQWVGADPSKARAYLPKDKQYLQSNGANCYKRVNDLKQNTTELEIEGNLPGDSRETWCAPEIKLHGNGDGSDDEDDAVLISDKDLSESNILDNTQDKINTDTRSQILNESDFEDESLSLDLHSVSIESSSGLKSNASNNLNSFQADGILKSRKYDISITYDNFYRTPRIWLFGYDEMGSVLEPKKVFEDIMSDYAHRTVTLDPHPYVSKPHASIHPCQHATAMLGIINALIAAGKSPSVEQYLFIFLKFIQSVIPTIEYDFTMDIDISR